MSLDDRTQPTGEPEERPQADPLGIIGWDIAGKYKIRSYIGGGGFGEVYDAYNLNLVEQRLVIKFFKRVQARDRFDREARILCMLDHPNISRVIDFLPDEGALVVQYIDGKDTAQIVRESGPMPAKLFLDVARSITDAIAYAHDKKVAHRDIKPANILVDKEGRVYLIDFGIAKEIGGDATKTGYQALTPMFAAPERQTGESSYNPFLSDIYELGVTLFNFATNSLPYRNPIKPNLQGWGGMEARRISPQLAYILRRATHPDPDQRYQTAAEMADDLRKLDEVYVAKKKRTGLMVAFTVIAAIAIVAFLGRDYIGDFLANRTASESPVTVDEPPEPIAEEALVPDTLAQENSEELTEPEVPTDEQIVVEEEIQPAIAEPEPIQPEPVAPPPPPMFTVNVEPDGVTALFVDGSQKRPGVAFESEIGSHSIEVLHPDYPILRKTARVRGEGTTTRYNLTEEFSSADTLSIQLALLPPSEENLVEFDLNGNERRYTRFPVFDLECLSGKWNLKASIVPVNVETGAKPKIDSCVTFPYGRGPRNKIAGAEGVIELLPGESGNTVPLLIYWSE